MGKDKFDKDKLEILKHAEIMQRNELAHRREDENKIFPWVSAIMVAVIGALFWARLNDTIRPLHCCEKILVALAMSILAGYSLYWQDKQHKFYMKSAKVLVRIETLLHYFDEYYFDPQERSPLFPENWKNWGKNRSSWIQFPILLLWMFTIIVICLPK